MMRPPVKICKRSSRPPTRPQSARVRKGSLDALLDDSIEAGLSPIRRDRGDATNSSDVAVQGMRTSSRSGGFSALVVGRNSFPSSRQVASGGELDKPLGHDEIDTFEEVLDEYIELVRIEGRKALSLAKCQLNAALSLNYEAELGELKILVAERDESIATLSREIEYVDSFRVHTLVGPVRRYLGNS